MKSKLNTLTWVQSAGGPLLLLEKALLPSWHGIDSPESEVTDYDRACDIEDYIAPITVNSRYGIVFGDEPMMATWLPGKGGADQEVIVRWGYANDEESILRAVENVPDNIWASPFTFTVNSSPLCLFDSALSGAEVTGDEFLSIDFPPGTYKVETAVHQPDSSLFAVLHLFKRTRP